jgi:hypothetical protein
LNTYRVTIENKSAVLVEISEDRETEKISLRIEDNGLITPTPLLNRCELVLGPVMK